MCGLVGVAGAIGFGEEKAFKTMLILDTIRGKHSTGVASMSGGKVSVFKDKLNAIDYMDQKGFEDLMKPKSRILMAHNRYATRGGITADNAHPFEFEGIVGAHNGTITTQYKMHEHTKFQVDSQSLFSELNQNGVDSMWSKVNGAAALTWIERRDNSLHFLRNKERPLCYGFSNNGKTLWWASEYWMILVATSREGIKMDGDIKDLPINTLKSFDVGTKDTDVVVETSKQVTPYVAPVYVYKVPEKTTTQTYDSGKKHLEKEGVKVGELVEFEIEVIKDVGNRGGLQEAYVNVFGVTLKGVPVRIWSLNESKNEDLVDAMQMINGGIFEGVIKFASESGLTLDHLTLRYTEYTLEDVLEAEEKFKKQNQQREYVSDPITMSYDTCCELCDKQTKTYYIVGQHNKRRCCGDCKDLHTAHEHVH